MSVDHDKVRMVGRPQKTDDERDLQRTRLLSAAAAVVRRDGPGVSVDAIAAHAGYTKPLVYELFGSKAGLAMALGLEHLGPQLTASLAPGAGSPVRRIIQAYVDLVLADENIYRFIVGGGRSGSSSFIGQPVISLMQGSLATAFGIDGPTSKLVANSVTALVYGGVEGWSIRKDLPAEVVVDRLERMVNQVLKTWRDK